MTEYIVLLPGDESYWDTATAEERVAVYAKHTEFSELLAARGHRVTGGAELTHSRDAHTVRRQNDDLVITQGPYSETVEQLTGYYVVQSDDLDDLLQCVGVLVTTEEPIEVRAIHTEEPTETAVTS